MKVYNIHINKKSKIFQTVTLLFIFSILTYFLVFSKINYEIMTSIVDIFISIVIPSLFPFILFSNILIYSNYFLFLKNTRITKLLQHFFKTSYIGTSAIIFGFLFGYPNGARYVNELYETKQISFNEAKFLLMFVNNSSPTFILSSIGIGMFKNIRIGIFLLVTHLLSCIILGKTLSYIYLDKNNKVNTHNNLKLLDENNIEYNLSFENITKAVIKSIYTMCMILGFMIIFILMHNYILTIINIIATPSKYFSTFLLCIFEITSGLNKLIYLPINLKLLLPVLSFFLGFSSLSIIFQIFSCVYKNNFRLKDIIKGKLLHGIFAGILSYILINIPSIYSYINISQIVNNNIDNYNYMNSISSPIAISIILFTLHVFLFLIILKKKR